MDLFEKAPDHRQRRTPLAVRMRPRHLDEVVGHGTLLREGALFRQALQADRLQSLIFYGPPGTGKTTLARLVADMTEAHFEPINAVTSGIADLRRVIDEARDRLGYYSQPTIVFIDEIHRFNKSQQDGLLPAVEDGIVTLIGATTENPYFSVNAPLLSRARVIRLEPLTDDDVQRVVQRALDDEERGLGASGLTLAEDALGHLLRVAGGDARVALNVLELAAMGTGDHVISLEVMEQASQVRALRYDKDGDQHYDTVSAFIKSIRGSDPDAALYWLATMIEAGEDPRFIVRRLIVHASEDVGNADPMALVVACQAATALEWLGMPEARIPLAQATAYLATAPKSNASYVAIDRALTSVRRGDGRGVPAHLRDAHYAGAASLGSGEGYKYPHDYPGAFVAQQHMPDGMESRVFYEPTERGYEQTIAKRLARWRAQRRQ